MKKYVSRLAMVLLALLLTMFGSFFSDIIIVSTLWTVKFLHDFFTGYTGALAARFSLVFVVLLWEISYGTSEMGSGKEPDKKFANLGWAPFLFWVILNFAYLATSFLNPRLAEETSARDMVRTLCLAIMGMVAGVGWFYTKRRWAQ